MFYGIICPTTSRIVADVHFSHFPPLESNYIAFCCLHPTVAKPLRAAVVGMGGLCNQITFVIIQCMSLRKRSIYRSAAIPSTTNIAPGNSDTNRQEAGRPFSFDRGGRDGMICKHCIHLPLYICGLQSGHRKPPVPSLTKYSLVHKHTHAQTGLSCSVPSICHDTAGDEDPRQ